MRRPVVAAGVIGSADGQVEIQALEGRRRDDSALAAADRDQCIWGKIIIEELAHHA
jgi:hypothetical protein